MKYGFEGLLESLETQAERWRQKGVKIRKDVTHGLFEQVTYISSDFRPLLVVPFSFVSFERQFKKVVFRHAAKSYTFLSVDSLKNPVYSKLPYLLWRIEEGKALRGISPAHAGEILKKGKKHPFTLEQCLALLIQDENILESHYIQASGSRIVDPEDGGEYVLDFYNFGDKVKMKRELPTDCDPRWGTPSFVEAIKVD